MKADLVRREPERLKSWQERGPVRRDRRGAGRVARAFLLHDGPPFANSEIHIGHLLEQDVEGRGAAVQVDGGISGRPTCPATTATACRSSTRSPRSSAPSSASCPSPRSVSCATTTRPSSSRCSRRSSSAWASSAPGTRRTRRWTRRTRPTCWRSSPGSSGTGWSTSSSSRCTGASPTRPRWPRRSWSTRTATTRACTSSSSCRTPGRPRRSSICASRRSWG